MKKSFLAYAAMGMALLLAGGQAVAGGRYADPPPGLQDVRKFSGQALDALNKGDKDTALTAVQQAQKLASEALNEKSTMPMQNANSRMRAAIKALKAGNIDEARAPIEETNKLFDAEIEFYKKEGKL